MPLLRSQLAHGAVGAQQGRFARQSRRCPAQRQQQVRENTLSDGLLIARTSSDSGRDERSASSVASVGGDAVAHLPRQRPPRPVHSARTSRPMKSLRSMTLNSTARSQRAGQLPRSTRSVVPAGPGRAQLGRQPAVVPDAAVAVDQRHLVRSMRTPASGVMGTTCRPRSSANSSTRSRLPLTSSASESRCSRRRARRRRAARPGRRGRAGTAAVQHQGAAHLFQAALAGALQQRLQGLPVRSMSAPPCSTRSPCSTPSRIGPAGQQPRAAPPGGPELLQTHKGCHQLHRRAGLQRPLGTVLDEAGPGATGATTRPTASSGRPASASRRASGEGSSARAKPEASAPATRESSIAARRFEVTRTPTPGHRPDRCATHSRTASRRSLRTSRWHADSKRWRGHSSGLCAAEQFSLAAPQGRPYPAPVTRCRRAVSGRLPPCAARPTHQENRA
jgi:hypothetical protein